MKNYGFTLIEVLIALIILIIGFGVFTGVQSFLASQMLNTAEEITTSKIALDILNIMDASEQTIGEFKGSLRDLLIRLRIPKQYLEGLNFEEIQIEFIKRSLELALQKKINAQILDLKITLPSGFSKNYSLFVRDDSP